MRFELPHDNRGADNETLLADLRRITKALGKDWISREEYDRLGRFHPKTLINRFGSWNRTLERAGLSVRKRNNIEKQELLADLHRVAAQLGKSVITRLEYRQFGQYSERPFTRVFGGWDAALKEAGLFVSNQYHKRVPDDELFQNLEAVWRALGRAPKRGDMRPPLSAIGPSAYTRRFDTWRKALEAFVSFVDAETIARESQTIDPPLNQPTEDSVSNTAVVIHKTPRGPGWKLRHLVMRRDNFKCRYCGAAPAITPGVQLVIDHIVPRSKGGETLYENLQTLCEPCNGGKSDLPANQ